MTAKGQNRMTNGAHSNGVIPRSLWRHTAATTQPAMSQFSTSELLCRCCNRVGLGVEFCREGVGADDERLDLVLAEPDQGATGGEAGRKHEGIEEGPEHVIFLYV